MNIRNRNKHRSKNTKQIKGYRKKSHTLKSLAIALYITLLLLSAIPFAADRNVEPQMNDKYEYHLTYLKDGRQTHYYVERVDTNEIGKIDLEYTTESNSLVVETQNIKLLRIYCRSMYKDECRKVFGIDPNENSNYYKWYFIEKNHLNVNIDADHEIEELSFIDTPIPYEVIVNGKKWTEGGDYLYTDTHGTVLSNVPAKHTNVDIYFKPLMGSPPTALLNVSKTIVPVNHTIIFDSSESFDIDGSIIAHFFDFGDGTFRGGSNHEHHYSKPGVYGVILTVRDDDDLLDRAYVDIKVMGSTDIPYIQGRVPDQTKPEDSPPWFLSLTSNEPIASTEGVEFYWYLTGEDTSLYTVTGENGTDDRLVFTPLPDAFGSDLVTLWLWSTESLAVSQQLWINITPVNDPPTILEIPDLIVHYDDPYTFNYGPYVNDKETPKYALTLNMIDGYNDNYISVQGLNATINYPQELVSEAIYITVRVSDGEAQVEDVISIQVTSDYVPELVYQLPDVWLNENSVNYNVFDLDDYFMDPDNDAIYYSFGQTHLYITIHLNHTVDISAVSEWTGSELVTFRARDPIGALAEDTIVITVVPVNDPPTINNLPEFYIRYNHDYQFDLTPYVHDNDNPIDELIIIPSDSEHIHIDGLNNMIIIINYPIEYTGRRLTVGLTVFDGIDSTTQDVTVIITDNFPPELVSPLPDIVFLEDMPLKNAFDLNKYFLDPDEEVLDYTTDNKYIYITINDDCTVDFSTENNWSGTELVSFRAENPTGAFQEDIVLVTVLPVNDPPAFLPIPEQCGNESERWILDMEPYILDIDNNISELEITVDNELVVVSGSNLIFLGSRDLPKEIEITVSDGEFSVAQIIEVQLNHLSDPHPITYWDFFISILPFVIIILLIILIIAVLVYRKNTKFTVEEVFLILDGGTLITHLSRHPQANVDDVIFSGMFTAVQDFIRDSFTVNCSKKVAENKWILDELKFGENKILIERSKHVYLAVIFSGEGSNRLRRIVNRLLVKIETEYGKIFPTWNGDIDVFEGAREILSVLINPLEEPEQELIEDEVPMEGLMKEEVEEEVPQETLYKEIKEPEVPEVEVVVSEEDKLVEELVKNVMTDEILEVTPDEYECPDCGASIEADTNICPRCGAEFEEGTEEFECPDCGTSIGAEITICPKCGAEFE